MYFGTCTLVQIEKRSADFNNRKNEIAKISGTPIAVKYLEIKISLVLRSKTHAN